MNEPGSIWLWAFALLVSLCLLGWAALRPCWLPALRGSGVRRTAESHAGDRATNFAPVDAMVLHEDGAVEADGATGAGDGSTPIFSIHWSRSYLAFIFLQVCLLIIFAAAVGTNKWDTVMVPWPTQTHPGVLERAEIRIGLSLRQVSNAPNDERRWASGDYSDVCAKNDALIGCNFTVQATGALVMALGFVGVVSLALVLAYLLLARFISAAAGWGAWAWRICLVQVICTLGSPLIWAACAHGSLASRSLTADSASLSTSFFLALLAGCAALPLLYCLRLALIMIDSGESAQWNRLGLLEHELHAASSEQRRVDDDHGDEDDDDDEEESKEAPPLEINVGPLPPRTTEHDSALSPQPIPPLRAENDL